MVESKYKCHCTTTTAGQCIFQCDFLYLHLWVQISLHIHLIRVLNWVWIECETNIRFYRVKRLYNMIYHATFYRTYQNIINIFFINQRTKIFLNLNLLKLYFSSRIRKALFSVLFIVTMANGGEKSAPIEQTCFCLKILLNLKINQGCSMGALTTFTSW